MESPGRQTLPSTWTASSDDGGEARSADCLYANLWGIQAGDIDSLPEDFLAGAAESSIAH